MITSNPKTVEEFSTTFRFPIGVDLEELCI